MKSGNQIPDHSKKDFVLIFDMLKKIEEKLDSFNIKMTVLLDSILRNNEEFNKNITMLLSTGQENFKFRADLEYAMLKDDVVKTNLNLTEIKSNIDILLTTNENFNSLDYIFENTKLDICQKKYQG